MATETLLTKLSQATLSQLPPSVQTPLYDRSGLKQGIMHIGVGGFFRAHQCVYLDDLLHKPGSEDFGICGVGLLPQDRTMYDVMRQQDCLFTVVVRSAEGDVPRVIGSMVNFLFAPASPESVIDQMASEETKIVSLTITEGGYCENKATGQLDTSHPTIVHDLANPKQPTGAYGYMAEALRRRKADGQKPFTIQSCDNLLNNGSVCRRMMLAFLERSDPDLAKWLAEHGAFPNSMVDRITPATTDVHRQLVREKFNLEDGWPVPTEPFKQWVIEDEFAQGRPAWEAVGAQLVHDVEPYERMKIRLLNGSHQVMCYIGMLLGYRYAPQAMNDADVVALITRYMDAEVTHLLPEVPGVDVEQYKRTLRERFANPAINDQLGRIGTDGSARVAEFVVPTITENANREGPIAVGAFTVAAWIRFLNGRDDAGAELPYIDPLGEELRNLARKAGPDATAVLATKGLLSPDLAASDRFKAEVSSVLKSFYEVGARQTLQACLKRS